MTWVTTDNVSAETWRFLLEYANQELAVESIGRISAFPLISSKQTFSPNIATGQKPTHC